MSVLLLSVLLLTQPLSSSQEQTYAGQQQQTEIPIPRIEASAEVDGVLDEAAWTTAARLANFSQYQPVDGRPAADPTEVLVWYAPDAIYFGIRATELHGHVVRATQANRDNIASEDQVQILLDTNNDNRIAYLFAVNPLGVQADGTRSDQFGGGAGGRSATGGGTRTINPLDGNVDLNPDYRFDAAGRVIEGGYVVEVRIPFKSLRYQDAEVQDWGLHILRRVQHSGFQDTWAPAVRANASFLGQSGTLVGLHDLHRGLVLDLAPTITGRRDGMPDPQGAWTYDNDVQFGADVTWGVQQNLTFSGTVNPDFSQVEADVGQVTLNERFALFFPEKRPFFLEGLEFFDTPSQLIYTRRIINPIAGAKLAGKVKRTSIATIVAADDQRFSASGDDIPLFGIARIRHDLSGNDVLGGIVTLREEGPAYSRLAGADLRLYHSRKYFAEFQAVQSWTKEAGLATSGPLLRAVWDRTGRNWGFNYQLSATAPDFRADAGFVNRRGVINLSAFNRLTGYGATGALLETYGAFFGVGRFWTYDDPGAGTIEGNESVFPSATLRGGWRLSGSLSRNFFVYDPALYESYDVQGPTGTLLPFTAAERADNQVGGSFSVTTPTFRLFTASASVARNQIPLFDETTLGRSQRIDAIIDVRPTSALRTTFQMTYLTLHRVRDDSQYSSEAIPRLKVEYQLTPSIFFRAIGQYEARKRAALRDGMGRLIFINGEAATATRVNDLRTDWLFSYRPRPGTLVYVGYGSTLEDVGQRRFENFQRRTDGFFVKVSYGFRV